MGGQRAGGERLRTDSIERVALRVSQSVVTGMQALAPSLAAAAGRVSRTGDTQEGGDKAIGGKHFSEEQVATLKGYCGVVDPSLIPGIWRTFQVTKDISNYRHEIRTELEHWEREHGGGGIDQAVFLSRELFQDILCLRFNPGEGVALIGSVHQGLTLLSCRPKSALEVEDLREHEEAMQITGHKKSYEEFRTKKKKGATATATPPENYFDLRLCLNTFCALIWVFFGEDCDYYKGLMEVRDTLLLQEVAYIRNSFTVDVCRRITWVIIDDGRSFFNVVMVKGHFDGGSIRKVRWPTSGLTKIVDAVRYAQPIARPKYPLEWVVRHGEGKQGGRGQAAGGGAVMGGAAAGGAGNGGGAGGGRGNNNKGGGGPWVDPRHPKIAAMMAAYISAKGSMRIRLGDILNGANKNIMDLPKMPLEPGGPPRPVCWAWVLGRCTFPTCRFLASGGHVKREAITDAFAEEVVAMLTPGVQYCVRAGVGPTKGGEGSPVKKQRTGGDEE